MRAPLYSLSLQTETAFGRIHGRSVIQPQESGCGLSVDGRKLDWPDHVLGEENAQQKNACFDTFSLLCRTALFRSLFCWLPFFGRTQGSLARRHDVFGLGLSYSLRRGLSFSIRCGLSTHGFMT